MASKQESTDSQIAKAIELLADRLVPGIGGQIPGTGGLYASTMLEIGGAIASGLFAIADAIKDHTESLQADVGVGADEDEDEDEEY